MEWTEELVFDYLNRNPRFNNLMNEENDAFYLPYEVEGNTVIISNSVGGIAETYILPNNEETIQSACRFAIIARNILQRLINNQQ